MARKYHNNYNIDLLRLCYRQPEGLFESLAETMPNTKIQRYGYYIFVIGNDENDESPTAITCNIVADDGTEIGTMIVNGSNSKYGRLCFFRLFNKALYEFITCDMHGNKANLVSCIDYVADDLGLEFVSVTELHIANDSNINKIAKLMHLKRDVANYDMIVNRKKIEAEKIQGYSEHWQSYRPRKVNPTIYIEPKKKLAPRLCLYNKSVEIAEESGKEYVKEWNNFGDQTIYRSELRLRWESLKEYFAEKEISGYGIFNAILSYQTLAEIFEHFASRLIYFKHKRTNEIVTLTNID